MDLFTGFLNVLNLEIRVPFILALRDFWQGAETGVLWLLHPRGQDYSKYIWMIWFIFGTSVHSMVRILHLSMSAWLVLRHYSILVPNDWNNLIIWLCLMFCSTWFSEGVIFRLSCQRICKYLNISAPSVYVRRTFSAYGDQYSSLDFFSRLWFINRIVNI